MAVSVIVGFFMLGFFRGKQSFTNNENEKSANQVRKLNQIKRDTARLSDAELDTKLLRWKRVKAKQ